MKRFVCFILCSVLLISGFPLYSHATEPTVNSVSLEEFTEQLTAMIDKYDNNSIAEEYSVNSISSFSVSEDKTEEEATSSSYSTDRLIVKADGAIDTLDAVAHIDGYNDLHILQFNNTQSAKNALEYYENSADVEYAQEDRINRLLDFEVLETTSSITLPQPMLDDANTLGFTALRKKLADNSISYSQEIVVAVIDTGIAYDHDLLKDRVDPNGYDAINGTSCYDDHGHGTHVSGIIAANTLDNVTIRPYKVLNYEGKGTDSQTVLGVEAAIADGVDIINMSFGRQGSNPAMEDALEKAHKAGIKLIAAAGNDGINMDVTPYTPACCDNVITVMAYNAPMNMRLDFSNYGSMCETAAIGYEVVSSYLNNKYAIASGTSQAAPYVTAAVTYLVLDNPLISYDKIVEQIDKYEWRNGMYIEFIFDDNIQKTATPIFSVKPGEFDEEFYLEISCEETDSYIYYNLSSWGNDQTIKDYEEPIKIKYSVTVTAYAEKKGKLKSDNAVGKYTRAFLNEEDKYTIDDTGTITGYLGGNTPEDNTEIIVPDTINGIVPTAVGDGVFMGFKYLRNVVLPDSVTKIGYTAFRECTNLEHITARNVTELGTQSFYCCTNLKEFIGSNVTKIESGAFYRTALSFIDTKNVSYVGSEAFQRCTGLQSFISEKLTSLGNRAFCGSSIRYVEIPNVNYIKYDTFNTCRNLETVIITNATAIQDTAFKECTSLKEITSDKVAGIGLQAFYNCSSLTTAKFPLLQRVYDKVFYNCTLLKNFNSPLISTIGISGFENCSSLENANYQYLTSLSDYAFRGCSSIKNVNLPTLETLGKNVFAGCAALNEVWIKGDVTVEAGAFETDFTANKVILDNAISIKDLPENIPTALPLSVTSIEDTDFENVIIYGSKGSYGETWANENNQTFIEITTDTAIFQNVPQYCESTKETLSFDVMGLNRIYQWYGNTKNSNTGGKFIKNATNSEFIPSSHTKIYDYYYCIVICQDGSNPLMTITSDVCTFIPVITSLISATTVDLTKLSIKTTLTGTKNITDLIKLSDNVTHYALPSYSAEKESYFGTGSSVVVYLNGEPESVFSLVVYGDVNGDSICDVIDCSIVEKAVNGHTSLNNAYLSAADMDSNNKLNIRDYQALVNKAMSET